MDFFAAFAAGVRSAALTGVDTISSVFEAFEEPSNELTLFDVDY
jgi:hypothetical protein